MADEYAGLLIETGSPRFHVVGRHFGGLLGAEIARRPTEAGRGVRLSLLATPTRWPAVLDPTLVEAGFAVYNGIDPERVGLPAAETIAAACADVLSTADRLDPGCLTSGPVAARHATVAVSFAAYGARSADERLAALGRLMAGERDALAPADFVTAHLNVFRQALAAAAAHRLDALAVDLTILGAGGRTGLLPWTPPRATEAWRRISLGTVGEAPLGGTAASCLDEPSLALRLCSGGVGSRG